MKKLFVIISLSLTSISVWAQEDPLSGFFNKYEQDTSFTIINISPKMFNMFSKINLNTSDRQADQVMDVAQKLTGLRIITKDNTQNSMQLFHEASRLLPKNYEELMTIRDHGNDVKFLVNPGSGDIIHNLIMLIGGKNQFFALSLTGNINLNELSQIAGNMNIQGFDQLKNLNKNRNKN